MHGLHVTYLIIGAGLAGSAAAQAIRLRDPKGSVLLVGQEINRPYHRPPLRREFLLGQVKRAELVTLPVGWFQDNQVQLVTGQRVTHIDVARHAATLDTGKDIVYDRLLIATGVGARPLNVQGADFSNVFELRTIEHAEQVLNAIDAAKRDGRPHDATDRTGRRGRVAIVGSGLLGLELAETMTRAGLRVDLLVAGAHPWSRFAGTHVGTLAARTLEKHDVHLHNNARVSRLHGDGRVQRVVLDDGRAVDVDFVLSAIGTVFNRELLRGTPINAEKHILVDEHCRTSVPHVFAAGDCAAVLDPLYGKHRVLEHWNAARLLGTIAGANMAGDESAVWDSVSHFTTDVFGLHASVWGEPRHVSHRHTRLLEGEGAMIEFGVSAGDRLSLGVITNGNKRHDAVIEQMVRRRLDLSGKIQALTDPATPLDSLLQ